jgi:hypothetical protein
MADEQLPVGDVEIAHYLKRYEVGLSGACSGHLRPHRLARSTAS